MDPVALALLQRYPLPTSAGTANNYSRVGNEIDDQDQWDVAHRSPVRGGPRSGVRPADALPRRLRAGDAAAGRQRRHDRHARAAGHDRVVVRVELSAHVLDRRCSTSCASATRAARSAARAAQLDVRAGVGARAFPAFRRTRSFPNTLPTFLDRRLSAARLAAEHRVGLQHERDRGRRLADVAEGPAHAQDGRSTCAGSGSTSSSRRRRPARSRSATCSATCRASPTPARRSRASCSARCSSSRSTCSRQQIQNRAHFQEYFVQDDWRVTDRLTVNAGVRYTLNFPSTEKQRPGRGLQPADAAARVPRPGRPAARGAPAAQEQLRSAPRHRRPR